MDKSLLCWNNVKSPTTGSRLRSLSSRFLGFTRSSLQSWWRSKGPPPPTSELSSNQRSKQSSSTRFSGTRFKRVLRLGESSLTPGDKSPRLNYGHPCRVAPLGGQAAG